MYRVIVIALFVYLLIRLLRGDFRRVFGRPTPRPAEIAVETVKCPGCGTYFAAGAAMGCGRADCPVAKRN